MPARPKRQKPRATVRPDPALRSRARKILNRLAKAHPDWGPTLRFSSPLELLVATILAAQSQDGIDRPRSGLWRSRGRRRPPRRSGRGAASPRPRGSGHRGEPPDDLPEEGLDQGDVVLRSPWSSCLPADAALPHLSDQRPLPVPEEDEDAARGAAIQPASAATASSSASPAMIKMPSARRSPAGSSGAGARPIASTST